jgi:hypothetical protein
MAKMKIGVSHSKLWEDNQLTSDDKMMTISSKQLCWYIFANSTTTSDLKFIR